MIGSLFEAAISAVNSERAGDLFLYACAVALIVFFIVRRVYLSECASASMFFFCFLTVLQARASSQSSAEQPGVETHRGPPLTPRAPVDRPFGFGETLGRTHLFRADVLPFGRVQ